MENLCIFYVEWDSIVSLFHILLINVSVRFTGVENHNYFLSFFIPKSEAPGRDCAVIVGPMLFIVSWNNLVIQPQFQYVTLFEQQIIGNISTPQYLTTIKGIVENFNFCTSSDGSAKWFLDKLLPRKILWQAIILHKSLFNIISILQGSDSFQNISEIFVSPI